MKRQTCIELAVLAILVSLGAAARVYLQHLPNFAPVAALALFAGYYFRSWPLALALPIAVMAVSDWFIGGYNVTLMALVYGLLALPVFLRGLLRSRLRLAGSKPAATLASLVGLVVCAAGSSVLFFLVSNFGWWATGSMYEPTLAGLWQCYSQAIPFFRNTLAGDLCFAVLLFGGYSLAMNLGWAKDPAEVLACE